SIPAIISIIRVIPAEVPIIPTDPLVVPEVGAVSVTSPAGVLDLVDYSSSSDSDLSEDSLPLAPELPLVSPFLYSDDLEADSESEPAEQRPERHESLAVHDAIVLRWRDRVTSRPSSPSRSSSHDTRAPSSEPCKLLTVRKRVGPFPARRLAWRRVSYRSSNRHSSPGFTSDSSSSGSSSDSSLDTFSGPSTTVASSRLVYPPVMTPRYSEAFKRWRSASLSTPYPPTTSESSSYSSSERSLDSSLLSAEPSRKRCKSLTTLVLSSTPVSRSIASTHAGLLPPRKRFSDSYSPKDSKEEHMKIGTADAEAVVDLGISDEVGAHTKDGIGIGVEITASDIIEDKEEFKTAQRKLEAGQLMASRERAGLTDRIRRLGRENLRFRALLCIKRDWVDKLCITWHFYRRSFIRFVGTVMMLRRDLGDLSHLLRGVWDSAISLQSNSSLPSEWLRHWLTTRQPVLLTLSRLKVKAKMAMMAIMEMVEMEMVEMGMETIKMEETMKMEIQMRTVDVLCQLLVCVPIKTYEVSTTQLQRD
ncbi:hypothetical protein Tco_1138030, partial [Tanacetum coccineum]